MKSTAKKCALGFALVCLIALCLLGTASAGVAQAEEGYYVARSDQNYATRPANQMTKRGEGYLLSDVRLSAAVSFYVTNGTGERFYGADDQPLHVPDAAEYRYDVYFAPEGNIPEQENWAETGCKISYRIHIPGTYTVMAGGQQLDLQYIQQNTRYECYVCSSVYLESGTQVTWESETHDVDHTGYYRVVFTPGKDGACFDAQGNYGTGEAFTYHLYLEDAPRYYCVLRSGGVPEEGDSQSIEGEEGWLMTRYEANVTAAEYRSVRFFAAGADATLAYLLYERTPQGDFRRIDGTDAPSRLTLSDAGWYQLVVLDEGAAYPATALRSETPFGEWYFAGAINGYGYDASGRVNTVDRFRFRRVEEGDADFTADYTQYRLQLQLSAAELRTSTDFFITDGSEIYRNGTEPIRLQDAGQYDVLFSPEHVYARTLHYRYIFREQDSDRREYNIHTVEDFSALGEACTQSADYSVGLDVYLCQDLDFQGQGVQAIGSFSGHFYGGHHTLKNVTLADKEDTALFGLVTQTGVVERLDVQGFTVGDDDARYVGLVGVNYGTLRRLTLRDVTAVAQRYVGGIAAYNGRTQQAGAVDSNDAYRYGRIEDCSVDASITGSVFVGGVVGYNVGVVSGCSAAGNLTGTASSASALFNFGGVAGYSAGRLEGCTSSAAIAGGDDSLYAGGIAGISRGEVYFCTNTGAVSATRYAGGIVGYYGEVGTEEDRNDFFGGLSMQQIYDTYFPALGGGDDSFEQVEGTHHLIEYSHNSGTATAYAYAGGIVGGNRDERLQIFGCYSVGEIEVSAGSYAGGIAGDLGEGAIRDCFSTGLVRAKGLNGGTYVGGIAGQGGNVSYCASACTLAGDDYVGGIVGHAGGEVIGCYANVLLSAKADAVHVGAIAGSASSYDAATNAFGGKLAGNYYVGALGGVEGRDYARQSGWAAAWVDTEQLSSQGMVSPYLDEKFSREHWLGGKEDRTFPMLAAFEQAVPCEEFADDARWDALFAEASEAFAGAMHEAARVTYTVAFYEWNAANGDLYDGDVLATDNFDVIATVRVAEGETPTLPAFAYASAESGYAGYGLYRTDDAVWYVYFDAAEAVHANARIYAGYIQQVTTLESTDGSVLVEGEFFRDTQLDVQRVGAYCRLGFTYAGRPITPSGPIKVKYAVAPDKTYRVVCATDSTEEKLESAMSGKYLAFSVSEGQYFAVYEVDQTALPGWAWLLIGVAVALAAAGIGGVIAWQTIKKQRLSAEEKAALEAHDHAEAAAESGALDPEAPLPSSETDTTDGKAPTTPSAPAPHSSENSPEADSEQKK